MGRGAFLIFAKQAHLLTKACDCPAIDAVFWAAVGFVEASAAGEQLSGTLQQADFSQFCTAVQAIASYQQKSVECTPEMLQAFTEQHLIPLLQKHAGQVPEPCLLMWEDAYVDACVSSFRERLQQPFEYYSQAARGTQQYLIDRFEILRSAGLSSLQS